MEQTSESIHLNLYRRWKDNPPIMTIGNELAGESGSASISRSLASDPASASIASMSPVGPTVSMTLDEKREFGASWNCPTKSSNSSPDSSQRNCDFRPQSHADLEGSRVLPFMSTFDACAKNIAQIVSSAATTSTTSPISTVRPTESQSEDLLTGSPPPGAECLNNENHNDDPSFTFLPNDTTAFPNHDQRGKNLPASEKCEPPLKSSFTPMILSEEMKRNATPFVQRAAKHQHDCSLIDREDCNVRMSSSSLNVELSKTSSLDEYLLPAGNPEFLKSDSKRSVTPVSGSKNDLSQLDGNSNFIRQTATCTIHNALPSMVATSQPVIASAKPRLTLSAFRRPEQTVRLTDSDPSRILTDDYDLHSPHNSGVLGHGASSTVRLAVRRRDGEAVAVKCIAKYDVLRSRRGRHISRRHMDEWELLKSISDVPNVVRLLDVFETDEEIQLVMEYCAGGELFDAIRRKRGKSKMTYGHSCQQNCADSFSSAEGSTHTESQAASITFQMLSALSALHSRNIVHRDVKPENILLMSNQPDETCVKLSDFGLARVLHRVRIDSCSSSDSGSGESDGGDVSSASPLTPPSVMARRSRAYTKVGSDYYIAPEVLAGEGYDTAVDIYSLGVTLYILLCGFPPSIAGKKNCDLEEQRSDNDEKSPLVSFPHAQWRDISSEAKGLIRRMLDPNPDRRITADEALQHSWIVQNCENSSLNVRKVSPAPMMATAVNLEFVRDRLFANGLGKKRTFSRTPTSKARKRRRKSSEHSAVSLLTVLPQSSPITGPMALSMAELYRGVASAAASATAAAAGVMCDEDNVVILDGDIEVEDDVDQSSRSCSHFSGTAMTALSV